MILPPLVFPGKGISMRLDHKYNAHAVNTCSDVLGLKQTIEPVIIFDCFN
jgi:hypothetical protein